ncbi:MAG: (E)-4-hydroxy-3-methylbut-2-enyl-diphosphate synthase, partial [Chlamydiia bacterium]|nr:(E)-4-hydroxy-3-methylbut-2-enyl-diphosphate synthase [Chlamydiia bacterium]
MRRKTREVMVGNVGVGGDNPIRIQSMTTSSTSDVDATVEQIIRLADEGCEIARVTVQGKKEAFACEGIKNTLVKKGYSIPLVADIHFYPPAAMVVADFVDKVRVNPGNYVDRRADFRVLEYNDETYAKELEKIEEGFAPLVEKCKKRGISIRIGTNHGSLSDRIMNRFGDSPAGMVESAVEFTNVCRKYDFHDIIYSMKASNAVVMIEAYRLLVKRMDELGWDYPLHLGVTEAGNGEEGRVKSAVGIGGLLLEGLGDTIRVSLTEDPWYEIDPCKRIIEHAKVRSLPKREKRARKLVEAPLHRDGSVIIAIDTESVLHPDFYERVGCEVQLARPQRTERSADAFLLKEEITDSQALKKIELTGIPILKEEDYCFYYLDGPLPITDKPIILCYEGSEDPLIRASAEVGA